MKKILKIIILMLAVVSAHAETPRPCTVKSSLPIGELTFMCYNLGANPDMTIEEQKAYTPQNQFDATVYGGLYQWGRPADGHEKRTSELTYILSPTETPNHGKFVVAPESPNDWCELGINNLWCAAKTANDPCPEGWRVPTRAEWESVLHARNGNTLTWLSDVIYLEDGSQVYEKTAGIAISTDGGASTSLFLPVGGFRRNYSGMVEGGRIGTEENQHPELGFYWSSTSSSGLFAWGYIMGSGTDAAGNTSVVPTNFSRATGQSVRCIFDYNPIVNATLVADTICRGEAYENNGFSLPPQENVGLVVKNLYLPTEAGCDSVITLHLTVRPAPTTNLAARVRINEPYQAQGFRIAPTDQTGNYVYEQKLTSSNGCDSTVILRLAVFDDLVPDRLFTPNGDGVNDTWQVKNIETTDYLYVIIFDRYGKKLQHYDVGKFTAWDGRYLGKPMPAADYWYLIKTRDGQEFVGHFSLKR